MDDKAMGLMLIGIIWWTALIAELAYRNGVRNEKAKMACNGR